MKSLLVFLLLATSTVSHAEISEDFLVQVLNSNTGVNHGMISGTGKSCSLEIHVGVEGGCDPTYTYSARTALGESRSFIDDHDVWDSPGENTISACDRRNPESCTFLSFDALSKKILSFTVQESKESVRRCELDSEIKAR